MAQRFNTLGHSIDPIGNSPVIIHKAMFAPLASEWHHLALAMKRDGEASKVFGWVLEMWAYAIASAQANIQHSLHTEFMAQPPYDRVFQVRSLVATCVSEPLESTAGRMHQVFFLLSAESGESGGR